MFAVKRRFHRKLSWGDACVSVEGVSIFKLENQEFVKTGRRGQFARTTHDEGGVTHIYTLQQETVRDIIFDRKLDSGSLLGASIRLSKAERRPG